jgi:hypothetical protein
MLVTNQTNQDYWFGPLHLAAGVGQTLTVDDTTETSLYLTDDAVADALNNLYVAGKITVSSAAAPFPRPTGAPELLHGDGSPEGSAYAPQGSVYMRRDQAGLYVKTTAATVDTGWVPVGVRDPWSGFDQAMGLVASTFPIHMANSVLTPNSSTAHGHGVWLPAGLLITGLALNVTAAGSGLTAAYVGIYDASYHLQAVSANASGSFGATGWAKVPLTAPYVVPSSGLYYFADIWVGTTAPTIACISGATAQASQPNPQGQYPFWVGNGTDSTLISVASPGNTSQGHWVGAY